MRQYVKDGTTPSLLRHSFSLEILEFNRLTSQLGPFLDKTGCRTPPPIVTGRTRLFPTLNSNCFRGVDSLTGDLGLAVRALFLSSAYGRPKVFHHDHPENTHLGLSLL